MGTNGQYMKKKKSFLKDDKKKEPDFLKMK